MSERYDAIVTGLGAMGSAALYQLAKRGAKALGIDQFSPPHTLGSTHGDTRITRLAIGEGEHYTPLALRSHELWREIEQATGGELLTITGGLIISSRDGATIHGANFFENTLVAAKAYDIRHELLNATEMRARFPQFSVRDGDIGYYEYGAGFVRPERCVAAQLRLARELGAEIRVGEKVDAIEDSPGGVTVRTDCGVYEAQQIVVSAGPWLPELIEPEYSRLFTVRRQVLYWFDIDGPADAYSPERFPIFIWDLPGWDEGFYGFPAIDGPRGGVKVATEQYEVSTTPDAVQREASANETRSMYEKYVAPYLPGLTSECVKAVACLYTVTPDGGFVIDRHPERPSMIIASPCSGHGFKHSAAVGEVLAELVTGGRSAIDITKFSFARFGD